MRNIYIIIVVLLSAVISSCTSARWTVKDKTAIDQNEYEIIEQYPILMSENEPTPENPVFSLNLYSKQTYEYSQRVLMQRNIQEYRLRPGFVALGLGGAGMAFYLANAGTFRGSKTSEKSITLNVIGGFLALSGVLNMKPVGESRPTGEERYLRSSGTTLQVDTVRVREQTDAIASLAVRHNERLVFEEENRLLSGGSLNISLASILNELQLSGPNPGSIRIEINFADSTYHYQYPVEKILQSYAHITSQLAELRNSPNESPDNVLADLIQGSQLQITNIGDEEWYQVLYGISENYIRKENAELIWRSTDFVEDDQVVTVPRVPFGNIDVESNIPVLRKEQPNAIGLVVTNQSYSGELLERNYAHRDGRLIKTYLTNALGYQPQNIFELSDIDNPNAISNTLNKIRSVSNDSTELFVYLSGYGIVGFNEDKSQLALLGISNQSDDSPVIPIRNTFEQIASIPSAQTVVLSDIDFSARISSDRFTANEARSIIEMNAAPLINKSQTSLLMGSRLSDPSNLYVSSGGDDKKHHIFPYFFSKALQQRRTNLAAIYQYLERNVSYTARKLHDRPQDPLLIGSTSLDFISQ